VVFPRPRAQRERWTLLRGGADDVRELAALLGVNYAEDARGQFAHSNLITLLNADGEIAFQLRSAAGRTPLPSPPARGYSLT
jgi:cytochrome oxidase Cu insertion factor (SCO1/SenC/PrrC family)